MFLEFDITYYFCYGEKSVKLFQYKTFCWIKGSYRKIRGCYWKISAALIWKYSQSIENYSRSIENGGGR